MENENPDINERYLRITGSAFLEDKLDTTRRFNITGGELEPYSVEKKDRQNGSYDVVYKAKFASHIELEQAGKKILGKDRTGKSKKLRGAIYYLSQGQDIGDEAFYEVVMDKIINNLPEIWEYIRNK